MTDMSEVSEVIDTAEAAEGTIDLVSRTLTLVEAPENLEIKAFLDKPFVTEAGELVSNIVPHKYKVSDLHIAALHLYLDGVEFPVETAEGMSNAKRIAARLSKLKTEAKDEYTAWNSPILEMTADSRSKRDHIVAEIDSILTPIKAQIDAQTAKEAEERTRKARIESDRITAHTSALKVLQDMPGNYLSESSETIARVIAEISSFDYLTRRDWQEYLPAATDAIRANVTALQQHLENAKAREAVARMEAENREAEEKRAATAALRQRIHDIELAPNTMIGATSEAIQRKMARLDLTDPATFGELADEAKAAIENARNLLQTMLDGARKSEAAQRQAADDAAELAKFRADAARQKQEQDEAAERAERDKREAAEAAAKAEREEAERVQREKDEAARVARERAEAVAETLRDLLIEARDHIPAGDLADRIDAAIATVKGE